MKYRLKAEVCNMNYIESIKYLEEEVGFASVPGLSRIQALLKRLGKQT